VLKVAACAINLELQALAEVYFVLEVPLEAIRDKLMLAGDQVHLQ
jgi:hypothetical protein